MSGFNLEVDVEANMDSRLAVGEPMKCRLDFPEPRVVRVRVGAGVQTGEDTSSDTGVSVEEDSQNGVTYRTAEMAVEVSKRPLRVTLKGPNGGPTATFSVYHPSPLTLFELRVPARPDARVYGCGERFDRVDQANKVVRNRSVDQFRSKYDDTYAPIPWFMSTQGYGLLLNNTGPSVFDFRLDGRDYYEIRGSDAATNGLPSREAHLDVYLIYGPDLHDIYSSYIRTTGAPYMMPQWAFEPLMGRAWPQEFTPDLIEEYIQKFEELDLPHRTFYFDGFWEAAIGDLTFRHFVDAKGLVDRLHDKGYRIVLWTAPWLQRSSKVAPYARQMGYLCAHASDRTQTYLGRPLLGEYFIDFTNPEAVRWYKERIRNLLELGVDGLFADFGEADDILNAAFSNGETGRTFGETYTVLYHKVLHEVCREVRGEDFYLIARAGWTGIQKWTGLCSGDQGTTYDYIPAILSALQSAGVSGQPFVSHCLGGYAGDHTKGPYLRWIQFGVFGPLFSIWNQGGNLTEPWSFDDPEVVAIYKKYVDLRMKLMPHIYSYAKRAGDTGLPMVQPLAFAFPGDPEAARHEDEYLFGEEFLVAPIYNDEGKRTVYLPQDSTWYDFWTLKAYDGGREIDYEAPLDTLPVFVRGGSLVATVPSQGPGTLEDLQITIYPGRNAALDLFYDGEASRIEMEESEQGLSVRAEPLPCASLWLKAAPAVKPEGVSRLEGRELAEFPDLEGLRAEDEGWCYEQGQATVWVKYAPQEPTTILMRRG